MRPSDTDLIRDFADHGSQAAFATLVSRHLNLVYSAARRQVRSPQLAEDVAQSVFCDLARNAGRLDPATPLTGWLYLVTRRTAIDAIRKETRRRSREQAAGEISAMNATPDTWTRIEPLLDEAMETLPEADRGVLLLRFFEDKSLREVGATLGTSDDAAQKRVSRAVEQLRTFFLKRGIATTAAGLTADLLGHAMLTAPATLGPSITTVALAGSATAATPAIVMTLTQKILAGTALAALLGVALYQALPRFTSRPPQSIAALTSRPVDVPTATARSVTSVPPASRAAQPVTPAQLWDQRVATLKQLLDELPAQRLPELKLLTPADWIEIARAHELDTAADLRVALADLRALARKKIAAALQEALRRFTEASAGQLPTEIAQLAPHLTAPADAEMLARYELIRTGKVGEPSEKLLREKATSDLILSIGLDTWDLTNNSALPAAFGESDADAFDRMASAVGTAVGDDPTEKSEMTESIRALAGAVDVAMKTLEPVFGDHDAVNEALKRAVAGFTAAHPGETPVNVGQVLPFLQDSEKFAAAFRPVSAHLAYLREHDGHPPASPAQLQPYLARPFSATDAFREMKLQLEGGRVTVDFDLPDSP